ncbi:MAG: SipW-dependent-type signal peptide-containing protein [Clostridiales bacterium]|nr:SipW-dependent-type signal peptide-containing protein [Clostridiales bacterium]
MKQRLLAGAVIVMCLSLLTYGTLAYFTAEDTAHNVITSGEIDIELQEWADEEKTIPFPADGMNDVMPGTDVTKIVEIRNTGSNAAYIRVKVETEIVLPEGIEGEPDSGLIKIDFNEACWTLGEDGCYYYNEALEPDAVTEPLFTTVSFAPAMGNIYQNSTAKVDVSAYAVQAANNGDGVMDAKGWPEE